MNHPQSKYQVDQEVEVHATAPRDHWPVGFNVKTPFKVKITQVHWDERVGVFFYNAEGTGTINGKTATRWGNLPEFVLREMRS